MTALSLTRTALFASIALHAGYGFAQVALEPGNWRIKTLSTTNGKADPAQDQEECLRDELQDLAGYFSPQLEGVQAKCTRSPRKGGADTIAYTAKCTGKGFTWEAQSSVRIVSPKRFTGTLRMETKTATEHAIVTADLAGEHTGPCKAK